MRRLEKESAGHAKEIEGVKAALAREEDRNVELATKLENLVDEVRYHGNRVDAVAVLGLRTECIGPHH